MAKPHAAEATAYLQVRDQIAHDEAADGIAGVEDAANGRGTT